jgi:hypothetical protein
LLIDEIAFARSTDGGLTWSTPIKINLTPINIPLNRKNSLQDQSLSDWPRTGAAFAALVATPGWWIENLDPHSF